MRGALFPRSFDGARNFSVMWLKEQSYFLTGIHIFYFASILCLESITGHRNQFKYRIAQMYGTSH